MHRGLDVRKPCGAVRACVTACSSLPGNAVDTPGRHRSSIRTVFRSFEGEDWPNGGAVRRCRVSGECRFGPLDYERKSVRLLRHDTYVGCHSWYAPCFATGARAYCKSTSHEGVRSERPPSVAFSPQRGRSAASAGKRQQQNQAAKCHPLQQF